MANNGKEERRFVIVLTDDGEFRIEEAPDGVLAAAQAIVGTGVSTVACMDKRFVVLYGHADGAVRNAKASVLAQEYVEGAVVIACGPSSRMRCFSHYHAKDTVKHLWGLTKGARYV